LLIKYTKSVLWRVAKCLSYIEEARCLKVKLSNYGPFNKNTVYMDHIPRKQFANCRQVICFSCGILYIKRNGISPSLEKLQGHAEQNVLKYLCIVCEVFT